MAWTRRSVFRRFFAFNIGTMLVLSAMVAGTFFYVQRDFLTDAMHTRGEALASSLANASRMSVFSEDPSGLEKIAKEALSIPPVSYVLVYTAEKCLFAGAIQGVDAPCKDAPQLVASPTTRRVVGDGEREYQEFACPVMAPALEDEELLLTDSAASLEAPKVVFGMVVVGLARDYIWERARETLAPSLVILLLVLLVGSALAFVLARNVTAPIRILTAHARRVGDGDLSVEFPAHSRDEIGVLGRTMNKMQLQIRERERALKEAAANLEQRVDERTNEIKAANRELEDFSYVVSHDLQEPLRSITSFADILVEEKASSLDQEARDFLKRIQAASGRMRVLIADLLRLSRIGRASETDVQAVDLTSMFGGLIDDLQAAIKRRNGRVDIQGPMPSIDGNPVRIRELFMNLIGNALKFNEAKVPTVTVSATEDERQIVIVVEDNGIGVPEEFRRSIFDVFSRLHRSDEYEGSGAGLTICRKIVHGAGGSIWVEPATSGRGSRFVVLWPKPPGASDGS